MMTALACLMWEHYDERGAAQMETDKMKDDGVDSGGGASDTKHSN